METNINDAVTVVPVTQAVRGELSVWLFWGLVCFLFGAALFTK